MTSKHHTREGATTEAPQPEPAGSGSHAVRVINVGPWGNLGSSFLLIGLFPLFPMIAEWWDKHTVGIGTLTITAAIYAITIGISSRWLFMLFVGIIVGLLEAFSFGTTINAASVNHPGSSDFLGMVITSADSSRPPHAGFTLIVIAGLLVSVAVERSLRHVKDREEFFEFVKVTGA